MKDQMKIVFTAQAENEPVFVIRAKDKCSLYALASYFTACHLYDVNQEHKREIQEIYFNWIEWQKNHPEKVKLPD